MGLTHLITSIKRMVKPMNVLTINLSATEAYRTQRNNEFKPYSTCNVTSCAAGIQASKIPYTPLPGHESMQLEDQLYLVLDSKESWAKARKDHAELIAEGYEPRHIWRMLEWGMCKFTNYKAAWFTEQATIQEMLFNIAHDRCAVCTGGRFTRYGHIVTLMGFTTKQLDVQQVSIASEIDLARVVNVIIDDPYGNYFTHYSDTNGNDIPFTVEQFNWITKTYSDAKHKYALMFQRMDG